VLFIDVNVKQMEPYCKVSLKTLQDLFDLK